ncbi:N-sulphoglucosamine sulphohydrolase-like [Gigantopelta aegis]|uniref:N-sulphoglucosamine sulphohydrolase-like n=1 Tax=Gigantopelta aegis TaxID=1735272 RepID=UPI001B88A850|nr:N-sulphoglucosamine sulphohydrolase-like [Gigantopelta aegis]
MKVVFVICSLLLSHVKGMQYKKNVLLIFGDDAGIQMGAYNNSACKTPNFDKLAARSVLFKHGYTSVSSCSPSRSVLLTGLPQHQNGMYGLAHGVHHFSSFDKVRSLPLILKQAGIRTGIIGKKHVSPDTVYKFDYEQTEENNDLNQVGRNITFMKSYVREFLQNVTSPFFLYIAFHDPHRCGDVEKLGQFCERFGNGVGHIPDWTPVTYRQEDVVVPYYLPDTLTTRRDLANMYTTYSRMDQGIGLFLNELKAAGHDEDTMILYTSDNGIPFPGAKTNLYDPGMGEPMMISSPLHKEHWGKVTDGLGSTMDFVPTILDWFDIQFQPYKIMNNSPNVTLTGKSLLPILANPHAPGFDQVFSSHNLHEVTMYYPMRVLRTDQFKIIHNLNHRRPYPIATDIYQSPSFLEILNKTESGQPTQWLKSLKKYYYRDQWELYDLIRDPFELNNLAFDPLHGPILKSMRNKLLAWQSGTDDPWRCAPSGNLMTSASVHCLPLHNGEQMFPNSFP